MNLCVKVVTSDSDRKQLLEKIVSVGELFDEKWIGLYVTVFRKTNRLARKSNIAFSR